MISAPELKKHLNKTLKIQLNSNREIQGKLIGYDIFLNLNLVEVNEIMHVKKAKGKQGGKGKGQGKGDAQGQGQQGKGQGGLEYKFLGSTIIRGNSIISVEIVD
ncbi:unnamed protein product [Ambrosiozyma monospora]|uniref:Sm protein G n=1 Tax=Ambrosiozyma monospora TaxID=43982 RepID=A0A9W6Z4U1_AMBMO|nr:unnamed protein product [Ambrosiozyma monospora]